jgi:hypothetical protein
MSQLDLERFGVLRAMITAAAERCGYYLREITANDDRESNNSMVEIRLMEGVHPSKKADRRPAQNGAGDYERTEQHGAGDQGRL